MAINLSGLTNLENDLAVLEKYGPALVGLLSGSGSESIALPAESTSLNLGSLGTFSIEVPATTIVLKKTA